MNELSEANFKRINLINWLMAPPLLLLFSGPYYIVSQMFQLENLFTFPGAFLSSLAFSITILHGHVTLALGSSHRSHYYRWLEENSLSYGLLFHKFLVSTRFRILLLIASLIIFVVGWLARIS